MVLPLLLGAASLVLGARADKRAQTQFEDSRQFSLEQEQRQNALNEQNYQRARADSEADYQRARADALADVDQQFVRLRAAAEKGGFNPLAVLPLNAGTGLPASVSKATPGMPLAASGAGLSPTGSSNFAGAALADLSLMAAERLGTSPRMRAAANLQAFQANKNRLNARAAQMSLRPQVGGVYASGQGAPRLRATGGDNGSRARRGSSGVGPAWPAGAGGWSAGRAGAALSESDAADRRREVQHGKIVTDVGVMKMDNPNGRPFYVPASGGQPLDNDQYFSIGLGYLGTRAFEYYTRNNPMSWGADGYPDGGKPGVPVPASVYDMRLGWGASPNRYPSWRPRSADPLLKGKAQW